MFLIAWSACTQSAPSGPPATQGPGKATPGPFEIVDLDASPNRWTPADGWILTYVRILDDVTGDGLPDAAVGANLVDGVGQDGSTFLVAGPLRRSVTLPGGEVAELVRTGLDSERPATGDATGDGGRDLFVVASADNDHFLLDGPLSGMIDPTVTGTRVDGWPTDVDGDGLLDLVRTTTAFEVQITWGPLSRWASSPPDLVIQPTCEERYGFLTPGRVVGLPDLDGDGVREVYLEDGKYTCRPWLVPLPSGGTYVPADDPKARYDVLEPSPVADQDGDGLADVWTWRDHTVRSWPITVDASGMFSSATSLVADSDLHGLYPMPYDLDGDGLSDWLGLDAEVDTSEVWSSVGGPPDLVKGETLVLVSGGSAIADPTYRSAWDIEGHRLNNPNQVFFEDGVVSAVAFASTEVVVVDLGAGVSVSP